MVGEFSPALSSRLHGRAGPPLTTLTTRRPEGRHHLGDVHHKEASTSRRLELEPHQREPHEQHKRQASSDLKKVSISKETTKLATTTKRDKTSRLVRPYIHPIQRLAPPSLSLRPPSSSCGNVPEGGRSSVPPPHSTNRPMANDLPRPFPHTKRGENWREN